MVTKEGLTLGKTDILNVLQCFIGFGVFDQSDVLYCRYERKWPKSIGDISVTLKD
jgi:hypothetical protein